MEAWHILIAIGIIAFIAEIFTVGFIAGAIGIGFIFAAIGNFIGLEIKWQILLFALGITLTYFLIRPFMAKYGYRKDKVKTNRDALIDKNGTVTEEINPLKNTGRVKIDGDDWKAKSLNNEIIEIGTIVTVVDIDSIILIVKPSN
ncbi:MAG: NfeD family protein [Bacteroidales bacterium]|nr:NfeD family protein [Bacteroidales bacterium]